MINGSVSSFLMKEKNKNEITLYRKNEQYENVCIILGPVIDNLKKKTISGNTHYIHTWENISLFPYTSNNAIEKSLMI